MNLQPLPRRSWCADCGQPRPLGELIVVTPVARPDRPFYVCRPSIAYGQCFRSGVGPASVHRIALALPRQQPGARP